MSQGFVPFALIENLKRESNLFLHLHRGTICKTLLSGTMVYFVHLQERCR